MTQQANIDEYSEVTPDGASEMYDYLISQNCMPRIAAAASTYTYSLLVNRSKSQGVVADYFDTTHTSIRKWSDELFNNPEEWAVQYQDAALLDELPATRRSGRTAEKTQTRPDIVEEIRDRLHEYPPDRSTSNLSREDISKLTETDYVFDQVQILKSQFGIEFGDDARVNVSVSINKSGMQKILDGLTGSGGGQS